MLLAMLFGAALGFHFGWKRTADGSYGAILPVMTDEANVPSDLRTMKWFRIASCVALAVGGAVLGGILAEAVSLLTAAVG
jgi:hypothetical protein